MFCLSKKLGGGDGNFVGRARNGSSDVLLAPVCCRLELLGCPQNKIL